MSPKRNAVIGTAGHVDHGKTALIKALTGIDTDRLAEEKKRGITIETGYAHLDLPSGERVGVVDVPGHERFIRNMLAGASGIDLAMLVVAADDGVMPQTREHLDILRLLGIPAGLIVLSKSDLVDPDWLELVKDDLTRLVAGTFLEGAPIIPVSAHQGTGLDELRATLDRLIAALAPRQAEKRFRLPCDRVFSLTGFGTVVTGTLMDGPIRAGETAMIYPEELPVKIRGLQVHSENVESAWPGQRVAVNLNIRREKLGRGDVLATTDSLKPSLMLDVRLEALTNAPFPVKNGSWVHLYLDAREILAKVILLEEDELSDGRSGFAQLRLLEPVAARMGDRFVIRFYSPVITVGGGVILDATPLKRRRHKDQIIKQFETKETGSPLDRLELAVQERPGSFSSLEELVVRAGLDPTRVRNDCRLLTQKGLLVQLTKEVFIHRRDKEALREKLKELLEAWHASNPFSPGMSLEEVRNRLLPGAPPAVADAFLNRLAAEKLIVREEGLLRQAGCHPQVNEAENELIDRFRDLYLSYGVVPPVNSAVEPAKDPAGERRRQAAFSALVRRRELVRLDDSFHLHQSHYDRAWSLFKKLAAEGGPVQTGRFRDELETSRKVAVSLLEYFDKLGLTKSVGEGRSLR